MSRIAIPTRNEILELAHMRSDICVSIYLETSPLKQHADSCRIGLGNLAKEAVSRLKDAGRDKRRIWTLEETLSHVADGEDFCRRQANSLAILATPDYSKVYRLANHLHSQLEISDRFYIKPLLRALTFRHTAYVLALSENEARVVELHPEVDPMEIDAPEMPKDAVSVLGRSVDHSERREAVERKENHKSRLARYARKVDEALRPLTRGCDYPLILAAAEPIASIYRSVSTSCLVAETIFTNPEALSAKELAAKARPVLDAHYAADLAAIKKRFGEYAGLHRVSTDLGDIARAATYGLVSLALVDFEYVKTGHIDDDGLLTVSNVPEAYGVIDEIAKRVLDGNGRVLATRKEDMLGDAGVAALLRYPLNA